MANRRVVVEIIGDADSLNRALGSAGKATSKFGNVAKAALISGAAAGFYALGTAAKIGFSEFESHQQVMAQTNAVIASTGGVAKVSAKHVTDLANAMLNKTGIDDEATQAAENMLLTFQKIGAKGGIFDQTTQAVADMATALNKGAIPSQDQMQAVAKQLGKAMNDPIAGLSRLSRIGVTFSDKQKEVITRLAETGHMAEAQQKILDALKDKFGGAAEAAGNTFGGQLTILREKLNNVLGDIVGKAIPYIQQFMEWVGPKASKAWAQFKDAIQGVREVLARHQVAVHRTVAVLKVLVEGLAQVVMWNIKVWATVIRVWAKILDTILNVATRIQGAFEKVIGKAGDVIHWFGKVADKAGFLKDAARTAFGAIVGFINDLIAPIKTVIGWVNQLLHLLSLIHLPGSGAQLNEPGTGGRGRTQPSIPQRAGTSFTPRGGMAQINLHLDGKQVASALVDLDKVYRRGNAGRPIFS